MNAIKISPTMLDAYRYYCSSDMSLEQYVQRLLGLEPPSHYMTIGIEFHKIFEDAAREAFSNYQWKPDVSKRKYNFAWKYLGAESKMPKIQMPSVVEVPVKRQATIGGWAVTVSGRLDAVCGTTGVDYKTTWRAVDVDSFADAFQWRMYLYLMPDLQDFRYEVFRLKNGNLPDDIDIIGHQKFTMTRYVALEREVEAEITEYIQFLLGLERNRLIRITPNGVEAWKPGDYR